MTTNIDIRDDPPRLSHETVQSAIDVATDEELIGYLLTAISAVGVRASISSGRLALWSGVLTAEYRRQGSAPLSVGLGVLARAWAQL